MAHGHASLGNGRRPQNGQAVVVFALMLLVLVAAAGLLIDGGPGWSNRRQAQTGASPAATP